MSEVEVYITSKNFLTTSSISAQSLFMISVQLIIIIFFYQKLGQIEYHANLH